MFLNGDWLVFGIISIPFIVIISIVAFVALLYLGYLILLTTRYRAKEGIMDLKNMFLDESTTVPNYEPAVMGYLVNYQKIGRREICSTLFDLIGRNVISITLKSGFVSDDDAKYILKINEEEREKLEGFEALLVKYLFGKNKSIKSETLHTKIYKNNLKENFYVDFLRLVQSKAKTYDFFNPKTAKRKTRVYNIINKVLTIVASIMTFLCGLIFEIVDVDDDGIILSIIIFSLITAGILWCFKFLISFMYNLTCYYNDFSKNGNEDFKKWMSFKKYLKNCSTIPDHPLMGVMVWERYYAYAIGLKCSKKFFEQMKKMKVVDNSINIGLFETFNDIVSCIGTSAKKIKSISLDEFGGSHVDY